MHWSSKCLDVSEGLAEPVLRSLKSSEDVYLEGVLGSVELALGNVGSERLELADSVVEKLLSLTIRTFL